MSEEAIKFIGDIKHRFRVPNKIITDLGKAFTGSVFLGFLPRKHHRRLLLLGRPASVQQPSRTSQWHGASSS
jgi:hypothetical protein